jgi:hypothetical protein
MVAILGGERMGDAAQSESQEDRASETVPALVADAADPLLIPN